MRIKQIAWDAFDRYLEKNRCIRIFFSEPQDRGVFDLVKTIKRETEFLLGYSEAIQLFRLVERAKSVPGLIAEVGTYMGGSAKLMHLADPEKELVSFDTFEGLPNDDEIKMGICRGQYKSSYDKVSGYLGGYPKIKLVKGIFPDSASGYTDKEFSLIHLDTDLHLATSQGLAYFYPRLNKRGIIISHDYQCNEGVRKAFDDYFSGKDEPVIPIAGTTQCIVIKA